MKFKKIGSLTLAALFTFSAAYTAAAAENAEISVTINETAVDFSAYDNAAPYIDGGIVMVPIRAIAEGLGLSVGWDDTTETVSLGGDRDIDVTFAVNSELATVNGENISLEKPAAMVGDRTFVPLSFIESALGAAVVYDENSNSISVSRKNNTQGGGNHDGMQGGGGQTAEETDPDVLAVIEEGSDKFEQFTFEDSENGVSLEYSLYVPENYDENEEYPLIMFIPDASGAGKSAKEIVEQYYGADIWVGADEQAKHESFVLVPAFSGVVVDDDWNTSEQIDTAVRLINYLTETYGVDADRLYTTGQSMGCMTSLYLNSVYPYMFAASLFVSGQWDISVLQGLENQKFFYITAGGDAKASGGQDEVKAMFDADGVPYGYGTWNAQNSVDEQNAAASELIALGYNANMIRFETGSVLNDGQGMEHNASFNYGYKIPAVRDWLFEQSK